MLWQSAASFELSVKELFEMDLKAFEDAWLEFAMLHFEGFPADRVKDSSKTE